MGARDSEIWLRDSLVSTATRASLRELNRRFLELVVVNPDDWGAPGRGRSNLVPARVAQLSADQKAAAANCPYALFDLRFDDDVHWHEQLLTADRSTVAEAAPVAAPTLEFVRLALFFAWHVSATADLTAQLVLGMGATTAAAFRSATIDCLPMLAAAQADNLTARWQHSTSYWTALTAAAARPNAARLRRVQLYGLQLAAAARLA